MSFLALPADAAWRHHRAREGFEVAYLEPLPHGVRMRGSTSAVEDGHTWIVGYRIELDDRWRTRTASISAQSSAGEARTLLEADAAGHWFVDGDAAPSLDGCLDVDLESSALTNTIPVHRLALSTGERAESPAAYVRALGLATSRLEQTYERLPDGARGQCYAYSAPAFEFTCRLEYDAHGLVLDYPGIAQRSE